MTMQAIIDATPAASESGSLIAEMEYLAYHRRYDIVHGKYGDMPEEDRIACRSMCVLNAVVRGGIDRLGDLKARQSYAAQISKEKKASIDHELDLFVEYCIDGKIKPRELYECILAWGEALADSSETEDALRWLEKADALAVRNHPDLYARLVTNRARLLFNAGKLQEAHEILSTMAERYYLVPDRNLISEIIYMLGKTSLLCGHAQYYKTLLFTGLRYFYTRDDVRRFFTGQILNTYRRFHHVFLDRELRLSEKLLFLIHWIDLVTYNNWFFVKTRASKLIRLGVLASVYFFHYAISRELSPKIVFSADRKRGVAGAVDEKSDVTRETKKTILVTRAMGGIGDLLMMTPGLHALKEMNPDHEIHFAIPRRYHQLFTGNDDVFLLDIEASELNVGSYVKWFNFTDCPAARVESRTMPNVKASRIDIFAGALGISGRRLKKMEKRPRYFPTEEERAFQRVFWKDRGLEGKRVIGIQLQAAEPYRDYPHMDELITKLATEAVVIYFHSEKTAIQAGGNVIDPGIISLRQAFALAAACDAIVAPDSAFVHLAAAFDLPCVTLFGPIDGKVRTMQYPSCTFVDVRDDLQCIPCWRNEIIPCKLTGMRDSVCMGSIAVDKVCAVVKRVLGGRV